MKKIVLLSALFIGSLSFGQFTTAYETGQDAGDPWTGWSIDNTNVPYQNINGVNNYTFTMTNPSTTFTVNLYRSFTITGTPINVYYTVTARDAELRLQYSTDGVTYTTFATHTYGTTLSAGAYSSSYTPTVGTYYIRMQLEGATGPTSNSANFAKFRIEESTTGSVGLSEGHLPELRYVNSAIQVAYPGQNFELQVYGLSGQLIQRSSAILTDVSNLEKGIYLVKYSDNDGRVRTIKIVR